MKLDKEFNVPITETTARNRVKTYFEQAGYQPLEGDSAFLKYKRGSRLGTWFPLNPSKLKCVATVKMESRASQVNVKVDFDLGNIFRDETRFTEEFWKNEIKEFETAIFKGEYIPLASKRLTGRTFVLNLGYLLSGMIWIFIWAGVSFILIFPSVRYFHSFNIEPDLLAIIIMVVAFFITRYVSRYWKKRRGEDKL
jgi:hypothetical protein